MTGPGALSCKRYPNRRKAVVLRLPNTLLDEPFPMSINSNPDPAGGFFEPLQGCIASIPTISGGVSERIACIVN